MGIAEQFDKLVDSFPTNRAGVKWTLLVFAVASSVGYTSAWFYYSGRISVLEERLRLAQDGRSPYQIRIAEVTTENPYRVTPSDDLVQVNLSADVSPIVLLPSGLPKGKTVSIKDKKGNSSKYKVKIRADGGLIDGLPEWTLAGDFGSVSFVWDGKSWSAYSTRPFARSGVAGRFGIRSQGGTIVMPDEVAPYSEAITEGSKAVGKAIDLLRDVGKPVANAYGLIIGDRVDAWRERNLDALTRRTREILRERDLDESAPTAEQIMIPLLEAAQGDARPEMQELWATLLANALDPKRRNDVRQEFIITLQRFHPIDALILKRMSETFPTDFVPPHALVSDGLREPAVAVSLRNLAMNGCVEGGRENYKITAFGHELVRACS